MEPEGHLGLEACFSWVQALATGFLGGLSKSLPLPELVHPTRGCVLCPSEALPALVPLGPLSLACSALQPHGPHAGLYSLATKSAVLFPAQRMPSLVFPKKTLKMGWIG